VRQEDLRTAKVWTDGASAAYKVRSADNRQESRVSCMHTVFHDARRLLPYQRSKEESRDHSLWGMGTQRLYEGQCRMAIGKRTRQQLPNEFNVGMSRMGHQNVLILGY